MGLVTDPSPRNQQTYGKFKPKSDLSKYGVAWAAVEGAEDARWPSLGEITSLGQDVGGQGRARVVYEEATFGEGKNAKTNDIKVRGLTLREVRVPIEHIKAAQKIEAGESNEMLQQFHKRPGLNRYREGEGGIKIEGLESTVKPTEQVIPVTENTPVT